MILVPSQEKLFLALHFVVTESSHLEVKMSCVWDKWRPSLPSNILRPWQSVWWMSDTWRDLFNLEMGSSQKIQNPVSDLNTLEFKDFLDKGFRPLHTYKQITEFGLGIDYKHP